ncbi:MAG: hypothetical protein ABIZ56_00305 [Chthoniobacteraceae bacterium]
MPRPYLFLSFLALAAGAVAQNPAQPALPVPVPPAQPQPPRPNVPALPTAAATTPAADGVSLQFPNMDVTQVLDFYERLTGRRLIRDNQVVGQINIVINQPIPKDEAIKIIEINLMMNGFTLVPVDRTDGKLWKVIGTGKNPRNYGIPIFSDLDELPDNEQIVTYLKKLEYADPTELAQVLGQAIPASPTLGQTITPLPKAGALLITENSVIIRGILRILREIDLPPAEVKSEFFTLQRADAKDVLEKLQDIIQPKGQTTTTTTTPGVPRPNQITQRTNAALTPEGVPLPGINPPNATVEVTGPNTIEVNSGRVLSEDAVVVGKTILQADQRTNRIHIVTRPVNLKFFRKLIEQLDADTVFGEPVTRPLKFVQAGDILQAMKQAISDPGQKEEGGAGGTGNRSGTGNRGNTGSGQNLLDNNRFGNNSNGGFGGGSGGGGTGGFSESLNAEERDVVPEAFSVGNTRIIADKRANTIIVIGNKDVQQKVFAFLDQIDVRSPQVNIHAVIGTLNLDNTDQFGVDYVVRKGGDNGLRSGTGGAGDTNAFVINPANLTNPAGLSLSALLNQSKITQIATGGASGLSGFFTAGNALDVIVQALNTTGRFRVTSDPSIFTSNNKKAVISSGTEIAVPTNITSSGVGNNNGNLSTNSSVQFKTVALQLEVLPLINADDEVELEVVVKIDELTGVSDTISGNAIPRIATRVAKTYVNVPNGATVVLGGLRRELNTTTKRGIPYLSKIPGLGALFRSTATQQTRDELIIMLRPTVTKGQRSIIDQRERELEGFKLEPDLEASLAPKGIRTSVPAQETFRRAKPVLREEAPVAAPRRRAEGK